MAAASTKDDSDDDDGFTIWQCDDPFVKPKPQAPSRGKKLPVLSLVDAHRTSAAADTSTPASRKVDALVERPMSTWTAAVVEEWVRAVVLNRYAANEIARSLKGVDGDALRFLDRDVLTAKLKGLDAVALSDFETALITLRNKNDGLPTALEIALGL